MIYRIKVFQITIVLREEIYRMTKGGCTVNIQIVRVYIQIKNGKPEAGCGSTCL